MIVALGVAGWWALLQCIHPAPIADEADHVGVIQALVSHEPLPHDRVSTPLTFHHVAAWVTRPFGGALWAVRATNAVCSALAALLVGWAVLKRGGAFAGGALLCIWNPLFLPYAAQAYSEPLAMLGLAAALAGVATRSPAWAAIGGLAASCVRQSNVVWLAYLGSRMTEARRRQLGPWGVIRAVAPFAAAGIVFTVLWFTPGFAPRATPANQPRLNPGQALFGGMILVVAWAPWLVEWAWRERRSVCRALGHAPRCLALLLAVGLLEMSFDNPHPANVNAEFLRNRLLMAWAQSPGLRWLCSACVVGGLACLLGIVRQRGRGREVLCALVGSLLYIAPHGLIEPRYFMTPLLFLDLAMPYRPGELRRLLTWRLGLAAALCLAVARTEAGGL